MGMHNSSATHAQATPKRLILSLLVAELRGGALGVEPHRVPFFKERLSLYEKIAQLLGTRTRTRIVGQLVTLSSPGESGAAPREVPRRPPPPVASRGRVTSVDVSRRSLSRQHVRLARLNPRSTVLRSPNIPICEYRNRGGELVDRGAHPAELDPYEHRQHHRGRLRQELAHGCVRHRVTRRPAPMPTFAGSSTCTRSRQAQSPPHVRPCRFAAAPSAT